MASIACQNCGLPASDSAFSCSRCGLPITPPAPPSALETAAVTGDPPLFSVATHKFIVLSLCTFSLYERYWSYQNWAIIQNISRESISPIWRSVFSPLWSFSLYSKIRDIAEAKKLPVWWSAGSFGALYLIFSLLYKLGDGWWWLSFGAVFVAIPAQRTALQVNRLYAAGGCSVENSKYSKANIATIIIGGSLFVLAIIGTILPATTP